MFRRTFFLAAFVSILPSANRVEKLELNHYYDENGKLVFQQWIGWVCDHKGMHVDWWRFRKDKSRPIRLRSGSYKLILQCKDEIHYIIAKTFIETWTQEDNEVKNRVYWPIHMRTGLNG